MHLVPLSSIIVGDRQRKEIRKGEIELLAQSILSNGLIHAIVVEPIQDWLGGKCQECGGTGCAFCGNTGDAFGNTGNYSLLAGERRLRAVQWLNENNKVSLTTFLYDREAIPRGEIPVTFREELSEAQRKEIELEENLLRVDLSWSEKAKAIADLHALRTAANPAHTRQATAQELAEYKASAGVDGSAVSRSLLVAKHLSNPKIAAARSLKEAVNILSNEFAADIQADIIAASGDSTEHILLTGSCLDLLPEGKLPAIARMGLIENPFDLILTDPPYGMGADTFGDVGPQHQYKDDQDTAQAIYRTILHEGLRLTKANAHLYMFCDIDAFPWLKDEAASQGWRIFRTPIIWAKSGNTGHDPWPNLGFRRSYECILYAMKGARPYNLFSKDVVEFLPIANALHPAAKPADLFEFLIRRSCSAGDRVLDPCCGVGTIFEAASRCNVSAVGIELDPTYAQVASNKRFGNAQ